MAMAGVDNSSLQADSQSQLVGLVWGRQLPGVVLHSSDELRQWLCSDDSTKIIVSCTSIRNK